MKRLLILFLFIPQFIIAQRDLPLRMEINAGKDSEDFSFESLKAQGCMVFYEGSFLGTDSASWLFMHYDTNFFKLKNLSVPLPKNLQVVSSCFSGDRLFVLLQNIPSKKSVLVKTFLATIDLPSYQFTTREIKDFDQRGVFRILPVEQTLVIETSQKDEEGLYFYNLKEDQLHEFKVAGHDLYSIEFAEPDTLSHRFLLGLVLTYGKNNSKLSLYETDMEGTVLQETTFPDLNNELYNSARMVRTNDSSFLILGTYNLARKNVSGDLQSGVYSMIYQNGHFQTPKLYDYVKLDDSLAHTKAALNLHLLVGDYIATNGQQFVLSAELFYPEYVNSGGGYYDFYSNFVPASPTFAGYHYINAYITSFDAQGNLQWNYYMPFNELLTQRLATRVSLHFIGENAVVYYPYNFSLTSAYLHYGKVIEPLSTMELETLQTKETVDYSKKVKMQTWYDDNFVISGYQYIKSNVRGSKSHRYVFFANKLQYQ